MHPIDLSDSSCVSETSAVSELGEVSRRHLLGLAGISLASVVLPQAAFAQQGGRRVLVLTSNQDIPNFDPHTATGYSASWLLRNVYDSLVRVEGNTPKPVPALAKSWTVSPDGMQVTFKLDPSRA